MYHRAQHVKAQSPRSEARRPQQAKAAARDRRVQAGKAQAKKAQTKAASGKSKPQAGRKNAVRETPETKPAKTGRVAPRANPAVAKAVAAGGTASKREATARTSLAKPRAPSRSRAATASSPKKPEPPAAGQASPRKPARKSIKEAAGVSTDAVARRTGKNWDDWFEVLDSAGAAHLDQRGVVAILAQKHGIGPWWQQMIAVGYESVRSKSDKPAVPEGFQISSTCTLDAPLSRVFRLWNDSGERARWLADDRFVVRATTADRIIRARWGKGTSQVAVSFSEKSGRTEVSVEHLQIESRGAADQMQGYWEKKLALLEQTLAPRT